ncbi:vWA domain-containing protein [Cytobacillus sp. IB215665]|uniref:vWA domain-containing protein n=1 Tax=Cytobacillus sp. IB215665 TaxID=3097357 RepID=UPI002A12D645|nr:VWA domain-containing protein [Cytobacillus sp. IB215665]MDX8367689.1 VWA domain-containing protein [Cytobacillus sp. IB215665]
MKKYKLSEERSVTNTDRFDRDRFLKILDMSKNLQGVVMKGEGELPSFLPLTSDLWASFYKLNPRLKDEGEFDHEYQTNHELLDRVMKDNNFQRFRETTKLDDLSSAIGTMRYSEQIQEWIVEKMEEDEKFKEAMKEWLKQQKELDKAKQKQEEAEENWKKAQENGDKKEKISAKRKKTNADKKVSQAKQAMEEAAQQAQEAMQQQIKKDGQSFSTRMEKAKETTQEQKEDLVGLLGGGAGNGKAELQKIPLNDQLTLANTLYENKNLKRIAEFAGKYKAIAKKKQKVKHQESIDRSGVTFGVDVERLLPQELALLKSEATKTEFLRRYAEGQTMMYAPEGKETLGKGPIVMVLDQSGSMKGDREIQSKGFALALAMIAKKQRHDFAVITFSNTVGKVFYYEKGKITPSQIVELAKYFYSGGTKFSPPLERAKEIIKKKKRYKDADIIFVTDGDPDDRYYLKQESFQQEWKKFKEYKKVSVISLLIGEKDTSYVDLFSDKSILAKDFNSENAHRIFEI